VTDSIVHGHCFEQRVLCAVYIIYHVVQVSGKPKLCVCVFWNSLSLLAIAVWPVIEYGRATRGASE
jgi:hypothetical protein